MMKYVTWFVRRPSDRKDVFGKVKNGDVMWFLSETKKKDRMDKGWNVRP